MDVRKPTLEDLTEIISSFKKHPNFEDGEPRSLSPIELRYSEDEGLGGEEDGKETDEMYFFFYYGADERNQLKKETGEKEQITKSKRDEGERETSVRVCMRRGETIGKGMGWPGEGEMKRNGKGEGEGGGKERKGPGMERTGRGRQTLIRGETVRQSRRIMVKNKSVDEERGAHKKVKPERNDQVEKGIIKRKGKEESSKEIAQLIENCEFKGNKMVEVGGELTERRLKRDADKRSDKKEKGVTGIKGIQVWNTVRSEVKQKNIEGHTVNTAGRIFKGANKREETERQKTEIGKVKMCALNRIEESIRQEKVPGRIIDKKPTEQKFKQEYTRERLCRIGIGNLKQRRPQYNEEMERNQSKEIMNKNKKIQENKREVGDNISISQFKIKSDRKEKNYIWSGLEGEMKPGDEKRKMVTDIRSGEKLKGKSEEEIEFENKIEIQKKQGKGSGQINISNEMGGQMQQKAGKGNKLGTTHGNRTRGQVKQDDRLIGKNKGENEKKGGGVLAQARMLIPSKIVGKVKRGKLELGNKAGYKKVSDVEGGVSVLGRKVTEDDGSRISLETKWEKNEERWAETSHALQGPMKEEWVKGVKSTQENTFQKGNGTVSEQPPTQESLIGAQKEGKGTSESVGERFRRIWEDRSKIPRAKKSKANLSSGEEGSGTGRAPAALAILAATAAFLFLLFRKKTK